MKENEKCQSLDAHFAGDVYRHKSDAAYKQVLNGSDVELIRNHNVIEGAYGEIKFALDLTRLFFGKTITGKALDVGCGAGFLSSDLKTHGFDVTGIDISKDAVELASKTFENIKFLVGNAAKPKKYIDEDTFDLIYIREFHPFTRVDEFDFQRQVLIDYLNILNKDGVMVISHGKPGKITIDGQIKKIKSLDYKKLSLFCKSEGLDFAGPYYYFLFNHLRLKPFNKPVLSLVSLLTRLLGCLTGKNWLEFYLIHKK